MRKGFALPLITIIAAALVTASIIGFLILKPKQANEPNQNREISIQPSPQVVSSPNSSPTPDAGREPNGSAETANWKTYTNSSNKYSVKYPADWVTINCLEMDLFGANDLVKCYEDVQVGPVGSYSVIISRGGYDFNQVVGLMKITKYLDKYSINESLKIDGKQAVKISGVTNKYTPSSIPGLFFYGYYINDPGNQTLIIIYQRTGAETDNLPIFEKMISTLKLLD